MAAPGVYFGTLNHQSYERAPKPGMDAGMVGFSETGQLENGGAYAVQSMAAHQELKPDWAGSNTELQRWRAYQQGKWGAGPFYWIDPYAANLMCPQWGMPFLTTLGDWRPIYPLPSGQTAATSTTSGVTNYFPNPSAEAASGTVVVAQNLSTNPSSEVSANAQANAGTGGTAAITRETSGGFVGSAFTRSTWSVATTAAGGALAGGGLGSVGVPGAIPVVAATAYVLSVWVRSSKATTLFLRADFSGGTSTAPPGPNVAVPANTWTQLTLSANSGTGNTVVQAQVLTAATIAAPTWSAGDTLDVDAVRVTPSTGNLAEDIAYFDGATLSNLVANPSFEVDLTGWGTYGSSITLTRDTTVKSDGAASAKAMTTLSASTLGIVQTAVGKAPAIAGQTTVASARAKVSTAGMPVRLRLQWLNASNGVISTSVVNNGISTTTDFATYSGSAVAPALTTGILVTVDTTSIDATSALWVDAVSACYSTGNLADDSQYVSDFVYAWAGTANASVSNRVATLPATFNPNGSALRWRSAVRATRGSYAVEVQSVGLANPGTYMSLTMQPGTYTFSADVFVPSTGGLPPRLLIQGPTGTTGPTNLGSTTALANDTWQRLTVSFTTVVVGTVNLFTYTGTVSTNGARFWTDAWLLVDGAGTTYFDGNSPGAAWTGAVNASTSTSTQSINWPTTGSNQIGATYGVNGAPASSKYQHVLLVPPDKNLYFGVSGSATGTANVTLQAFYRDGTSTTSTCTLLSPNGATRTNVVLSGATVAYVKIYLAGVGTIMLNDMTASLQGALTGQALDGQGTWALRWGGAPSRVYTYVGNTGRPDDSRQEMTATLIESYL